MFRKNVMRNGRLVILIARDVCRSTLQEKMMYGFLLLAFLFILLANVPFMVNDPRLFSGQSALDVALQIGFVAINIFTLLISIFISLNTLQNYWARERLALLLSKPLRRWHILEGTVLGLFEMVFLNWCLMTTAVWLVVVSHTKSLELVVLRGMSVTVVMAFLYISLVVFFYCLIPNAMAGVLTVLVIIAGFGTSLAKDFFVSSDVPEFFQKIFRLGLNLLPKINLLWGVSMQELQFFNLKFAATPILLHTLAFCLALNFLSCLKFKRLSRL